MTRLTAPGVDARALIARAAEAAAVSHTADLAYARLETELGALIAAATPTGLVRLAYEDDNGGEDAILDTLARRVSPRVVRAPVRLQDTARQLDDYLAGRRQAFDLVVDWQLVAPFGRKVLAATHAIAFGSTATYSEIASQAGSPNASRATGNALGANPIPIVIPCHRVLRTGGGLGGYTGGLHRKERLLEIEGVLLR